ncbi:hypothetical protein VU10_03865, partial [Desulfobulbus sp. US1]|nr:hypothetical protein [Desulfobulbus sp. US1]
ALFVGIGYSDKGLYAQAAEMYKQALTEDPYMEMAKNALQELKGMGLTSTEETAAIDEPSSSPPVEEGGSSVGTVIGVGLALAAVGGGAVYLLGQEDDDEADPPVDDDDETENPPVERPTVTAIPFATPLSCVQGGIRFQFSRDMDTSVGQVDINSPSGFDANGSWDGDYYFSWNQNDRWCKVNCGGDCPSITVTLTDFQDTDGNALSGTTTFSYDMELQ